MLEFPWNKYMKMVIFAGLIQMYDYVLVPKMCASMYYYIFAESKILSYL
jgi:hypothetical protein